MPLRRLAHRHRPHVAQDPERPAPAPAGAAGERIQVTETLVLDMPGQRLLGPEGEVLLPARAFQLLVYLVRHAHRVLCRRELMDAVWDEDYVGTDRVVDQTVCWLRRRIEPDPAHPRHLLTRHGVGYQYCPPTGQV